MHLRRPSRDRRHAFRRPQRLQGVQALEQRCLLAADLQGNEFRVNDYIAGTQNVNAGSISAAASLNNGFIVSFAGRGTGDLEGIYTQRFDEQGNPVGTAARVNDTVLGRQDYPSVASDAAGQYVVVWSGRGAGDREGVFGQRFDANGLAMGGEFLVNTTTGGEQEKPMVAMAPDGRFAVVWTGNGPGDSKGVFLQRFHADGGKNGAEIRVNVTTAGDQRDPAVGLADDGQFVVTWTSAHQGAGADVFARRFFADGTPATGEVQINTTTTGDQERAQVAMAGGGQFLIVWQSGLTTGDGAQISGQFFNADGTTLGNEIQITPANGEFHGYPQVAMADNGVAVVTWSALGTSTNRWDVFAQFFTGQGAADGASFRINSTVNGGQRFSSVALTDTGESLAAWTGNGQDDANGVHAQRIVAGGFVNQPPVIQDIADQNLLVGRELRLEPVAIDPDGPVNRLTWQFDPLSDVPAGMQIHPDTGVITWIPGQGQVGTFTLKVLVTDSGRPALADSETFMVTVAPDLALPSFVLPQIQVDVLEGVATQTIANFATNILGVGGNTNPNLQFIVTSPDGSLANLLNGPPILQPNGTLIFTPKPGATGTANFDVVLRDGSVSSLAQAFRIVVSPVNTAPQNIVLFAPSVPVEADKTALFSGSSPLRIQVQDADAGISLIEVSLELPGTGGGSFSVPASVLAAAGQIDGAANQPAPNFQLLTGDGVDDTTLRMQGSVNQINFVLSNLQYNPAAGFTGLVPVTMTTNDRGNTGAGGAKSDTTNFSFNVQRINQAPVNGLPALQQVMTEGGTLQFSQVNGNAITVSDADAGGGNVQVDVTVLGGIGTLSMLNPGALPAGVVRNVGTGTADTTIRLTGPAAGINAALEGLTFTPVTEFFGTAQLSIITNDLGNSGSGGPKSDADTLSVTVNGVNDPPVLTVPGAQTVDEQGSLTFNNNSISVADPDALSSLMEVTLSTSQGLLSLGNPSLVAFNFVGGVGTGTNDAMMVFRGLRQNINAALNGMTYRPAAALQGGAQTSVQITVSDLGNTGSGGPLTDSETISIAIVAVNDAPVNVLPAAQQTNEDTPLNILGLSINDPDSGDDELTVTLRVNNGTLNVRTDVAGGLVAGDVSTNGTGTVILFATRARINATFADATGLLYSPNQNFNGAETLSITTNDNGNNGSGGAKQDSDNLSITVTAINDAPVITVPASATDNRIMVDNPEPFAFLGANTISVADADVGSGNMQVTLTAANGTLSMFTVNGLNFTVGDGTADATMTFTGTRTAINTALATLGFTATTTPPDYEGPAQVTILVSDLNNTGAGGPQSHTANVFLNVVRTNNAPVNTVPSGTISAVQGSATNVNGVSIADSDAGDGNMQVTLTAGAGTISVSTSVANGVQPLQVVGNGTATVIVTAPRAVINTTFGSPGGLQFTAANTGATTITILTNDQGNTGAGGAKTDTDTINFNVTAGNMPPVNNVPGTQTVVEDGTLQFSGALGNAISISDPDAAAAMVQVQLTVINGTLSLSGTTGLSFTGFTGAAGDGTNDATMTFRGTIAAINAALTGMTYRPAANFNGADTLTIVTDDLGNTGLGGARQDSDTVTINVTAVNDAPMNTVPAAQTTAEDVSLTFNAANGNAISVADADAGANPVRVTLSVANGALTLGATTGLTFTAGDGTSDATMTFTGTLTDINAALNGLVYAPTGNFNGDDTLTIVSNDQGNTGGAAQSDTDTVAITVTAVNDAPVNTVPGDQTTAENTPLAFSAANANLISVTDPDVGANPVSITLSVTVGTLTMGDTTNVSNLTGNGTGSISFTGNLTGVNAALAGMTFTPTTGFNGNAVLNIVTNDQGSSGSGGPLSDTDSVTIDVTGVNNAPTITVPAAQTTPEDLNLVFSVANGNAITIADPDAGAQPVEVSLAAAHGTLSMLDVTGLTFTVGDGGDDVVMTFRGTLTDINAALGGLQFTPELNFVGNDAGIIVTVNDLGNTGAGGPLTDMETIAITVTAVNDAPVNSVPAATQTVAEGAALALSAANGNLISVADVDVAGSDLQVTLTVTAGDLTLASIAGLAFSVGDGVADATMTFTGALAAVNAALATLTFTAPSVTGNVTLTVTTDDQGATGAGGAKSDIDTVAISVQPLNDPPAITVPGAQTTTEDIALTFSAAGGNAISVADPDADPNPVQVTISTADGVLSLSGVAGLTFTVGDGTADANMTFTGALAAVNAALDGLMFQPTLNLTGAGVLNIAVDDQGNTGAGGAKTDTESVTVNVTPVNDPPTIAAPVTVQTNQNVAFVFTGANLITATDPDLPAAEQMQVVLQPTNGTVTPGSTVDVVITPGANGLITILGTQAAVNNALAGLTFTPTTDFSGDAGLGIMVFDDLTGVQQMDAAVVTITVLDSNAAPVITAPAADTTLEDIALVFSAGGGNAISVTDPDAGAIEMEVTLAATNGAVSLSGLGGLTFTAGDGTGDATMTFRGLLANVNAALEGLSFVPTSQFNGAASLTITVDDRNTVAFDGPKSDTETVNITVEPVNDAPQITAPANVAGMEDTSVVFAGANAISIADVDVGTGELQVTLAAANGVLTLGGTTGLAFTAGDGSGDATMTFSGTLANVNAALAGMTFAPNENGNGDTAIDVSVSDQGNTGGPAETDDATILINIAAVNDGPVNTVPQNTVSTSVNTPVAINGISVADIDVLPADLIQVGLSASNGAITLSSLTGLTFIAGDGNNDTAMTFQGTLTDVNSALSGLTFTPNNNFAGPASLSVTSNDLGHTGSGGPLFDSDVVSISVGGENQPPVVSAPAVRNTNEDTPISFNAAGGNAITVSDPDAAGQPVQMTLSVANGALTLGSVVNLSFTVGDGTGDASMTFTGTLVDINNAIEGLVYQPALNFNGTDTLTVAANDQGNIGTGGAKSDTETVTINVAAVDDPPIINGPITVEMLEDGVLVFSTANGNAISIDDPDMPAAIAAGFSPSAGLALGSTTGINFIAGLNLFDGSLTNVNNALNGLTFTPSPNFNGVAEFTFAVTPGAVMKTVTVTVLPVNDVPSFTKGADQTAGFNAGPQSVAAWATALSTGPADEAAQTLQFEVTGVSAPTLFAAGGLPAVAPDGTLTYSPSTSVVGMQTATISVRVKDSGGTANGGVDTSAVQTFTITINGAADGPPVLAPIGSLSIPELADFNLQLAATGLLPLTYSMQLGTGYDSTNLPQLTTGGLFSWLPLEDQNATQSTYTVTFRVTDSMNRFDEETVQITLNEVNSQPIFGGLAPVNTIVGIALTLPAFVASDADVPAQALAWSVSGGPAGNTATINPSTGVFNWTPAAADVGTQTFQITVTDNGSPQLSRTRDLTINVAAAGSAPQINVRFVEDTGSSSSDGNTSRADLTGTLIFEGANLMAFTGSFDDTLPEVDLIAEGVVMGSGNVRTFLIDEGTMALIRALQGSGGSFNDGTYQLTLSAKDSANRVSSQVINIVFDTVAPATPSSLELAPQFKNSDGSANAQVVTLVGIATPNAMVILNNTISTVADGSGNFTLTGVTLNPANVATDLQLVAADLAGNQSGPLALTITFRPPAAGMALQGGGGGPATEGFDDPPAAALFGILGAGAPPAAPGNGADVAEELFGALVDGGLSSGDATESAIDELLSGDDEWSLSELLLP